ncbi:MAG: hypothetical protein WAJ97_00230 [Terriglobales bacterium]|jgi:hypothetical protein
MTGENELIAAMTGDSADSLSPAQQEALRRGVAKIVALAAQSGVDTDQMIGLLQEGLSVVELLEYLTARSGAMA